ncbi:MAG TPA: ATP-binding protein [bacterium]
MSSARGAGRFSRRVFLLVAGVLLALSAIFTGHLVYVQWSTLESVAGDRSRGLGSLLATSARAAVYAENPALAKEMLSLVVGRRDVLSAAVFGADDRPIAAEGRTPALKAASTNLDANELAIVRLFGPESSCVNHEHPEMVEALCPVLLEERGTVAAGLYFEERETAPGRRYIGFVRVSVDRAPLRRGIALLIARSLGLMMLVLLLGGWAGYRLSRRVTEPLERLTSAVRAFGAGQDVGALAGMPDDEIGRLAEAFTAMTRDLAARQREKEALAERLRHAQKMEVVGALAQGIAHDFKNILSTLKIGVHLIEKGAEQDALVLKYTSRMAGTLERARELVERLLAFSRTRELRAGAVDLTALLGRLAPAIRAALDEQVRLQLDPAASVAVVEGDPASLEQLLMNLVYNARDAMPAGGTLTVRLSVREETGRAPAARISVADTGVGMSPEVHARIFEPFFTTKGSGGGTGLGLSIVRGIVEEHRGRIAVESVPGVGTTFHVDLPLALEVAAAHAAGSGAGEGGA